jgi:hypothetical protein
MTRKLNRYCTTVRINLQLLDELQSEDEFPTQLIQSH